MVFLTIEITKIPAALILVYFFEMSIIGAIIATAVAYVASIILLGIYARHKLKVKIKKNVFKKMVQTFLASNLSG